jgi:hypothetical protein
MILDCGRQNIYRIIFLVMNIEMHYTTNSMILILNQVIAYNNSLTMGLIGINYIFNKPEMPT